MVEPLPVKEVVAGSIPALPANTWRMVRADIAHECPEYRFELETHEDDAGHQMVFVHMRVYKWSKSTLKKIIHMWSIFRRCVPVVVYATAEVDDDKWEQFVKLFGFQFLSDVVCENGEKRRLFVNYPSIARCDPAAKEQNNEQHINTEPKYSHGQQQLDVPVGTPGGLSHAGVC